MKQYYTYVPIHIEISICLIAYNIQKVTNYSTKITEKICTIKKKNQERHNIRQIFKMII